jgi:hypothetical protein
VAVPDSLPELATAWSAFIRVATDRITVALAAASLAVVFTAIDEHPEHISFEITEAE